jgi:DNA-binding IclR family transcriptional regulator
MDTLQIDGRFCGPEPHHQRQPKSPYRTHQDAQRRIAPAESARIVERGFADCDQEIDIGIASLAAPVNVGNIGATFSVGAVEPTRRFEANNRARIGCDLVEMPAASAGQFNRATWRRFDEAVATMR